MMEDYRASFLSHGVHHGNWYDINIGIPDKVLTHAQKIFGILETGEEIKQLLNDYCIDVNFPSQTIESRQIYVGGEDISVPYKRAYERFTTRFYVSDMDGGVTFKFFMAWLDYVFPAHRRTFSYYNDYVTEVVLHMKQGNRDLNSYRKAPKLLEATIVPNAYGYAELGGMVSTLHECYPTQIDGLDFSGENSTTPNIFSISWVYRWLQQNSFYEESVNTQNQKVSVQINDLPDLEYV